MEGSACHLRVNSYNAKGDGCESYILKDNGGFHKNKVVYRNFTSA